MREIYDSFCCSIIKKWKLSPKTNLLANFERFSVYVLLRTKLVAYERYYIDTKS